MRAKSIANCSWVRCGPTGGTSRAQPPHVSGSYLKQRVKGKSSRLLLREYSHLNKACWGRHLWARGFFVASSGDVTDEVIIEYIRTHETTKEDDDSRVEDA